MAAMKRQGDEVGGALQRKWMWFRRPKGLGQDSTVHSLWVRKRGEGAAGFCHLKLSPALRPQLHLCPQLPSAVCRWAPISIVMSFSFPHRTQLLGDRISAVDLDGRALSRESSQNGFISVQYLPETHSGSYEIFQRTSY